MKKRIDILERRLIEECNSLKRLRTEQEGFQIELEASLKTFDRNASDLERLENAYEEALSNTTAAAKRSAILERLIDKVHQQIVSASVMELNSKETPTSK